MKTVLLLSSLAAGVLIPTASRGPFVYHHENVLGTSLELKIHALNEAAADQAEAAALAEIDRLNGILSTYDVTSEASRWLRTRNQPVKVSPELFEVLSQFDAWRLRTNGALDPAAEAVSQVWKQAAQRNQLPSAAELAAATGRVKKPHWSLDPAAGTATHLSDVPLRFHSFAKIYVADHATDAAMQVPGIQSAVVNIGGDLVVKGDHAETVAVADPARPAATIETLNIPPGMAVATSGSYYRGFDIGDRHYSHIVDPRTGQTAGTLTSATVVASSAVNAGALATAFTVLTPAESKQLLSANFPGVEYFLIARDGSRIASRGWAAFQAKAPASKSAAAAPPKLTVNFELARVEGQRYRRPYVAVWIEDPDKFPVRTIALWYEKPRWLPDLRAWNRGDRLRALAEGTEIATTVSSATRSPGKYSVEWDGKDNQGKPVKAGKFTVYIEVAREHGTYQLIRQDVDFNGAPHQVQLQGNPEVASASLEYR
jgi:thiamine biosynthesis lipoprotein